MLRTISTAFRDIVTRSNVGNLNSLVIKQFPVTGYIQHRFFGAFSSSINNFNAVGNTQKSKIFGQTEVKNNVPATVLASATPVRTVIKYSLNKGKRKTVKPVIRRFFRLNWGIWIRTIAGRHSKLWRKSAKRRQRYKQHVFCNATQCTLLDKMVTNYWKRPRYYVDDPYNPYQKREEFPITRRAPKPID